MDLEPAFESAEGAQGREGELTRPGFAAHSPSPFRRVVRAAWIAGSVAWVALGAGRARGDEFWKGHVQPLLEAHCLKCHSGAKAKSGLDLSTPEGALKGGDAGPAVVPGKPSDSPLVRLVLHGADPQMPPKGDLLSEEQVGLLRTWITRLGTHAAAVTEVSKAGPVRKPLRWTPPPGMAPERAVDRFLELGWKEHGVKPAREADDRAWVRRVHLDLVGRIPTAAESDAYVRSRSRHRKAELVDALLSGEEHVRHLREVWDVVLMGRTSPEREKRRADRGWHAYLEDAIRRNRPWNEVVRELIVARPAGESDRGAVWFLYERDNNPQAMAEAVSPVVFGVQMKCAQCHDHMVAREIKQAHYWGLVAAFNRTRNVDTPRGPGLAESAVGGFVTFANLKKESQPARLVFFNGRAVEEEWPAEGVKQADDPMLYVVPPPPEKQKPEAPSVPRFSRREALAGAVTTGNPLLARATVNRMWALVFGRGLVHPVDLMDSKHPASHPELLEWLARDFERSGHDVRLLLRTLVLSRAYALDSRPREGAGKGRVAPEEAFARALTKPLSAEQWLRSLAVATGHAADSPALRRALTREFPELFVAEYNATLQQAMFLSNSPEFAALLESKPGTLLGRMEAVADPGARVRLAFEAVYGRGPDPEEAKVAREYLAGRPVGAGNRQLVWALLTSGEFQLNH